MRTDATRLHGEAFDVLVVGGGIQGAALAREAALRGCRVLLAECCDYAGGATGRGTGLCGVDPWLHGCRPVARVREAFAERERLLRLAPHLVRPQPLLAPAFDLGARHPVGLARRLRALGLRALGLRGSTLPRPWRHPPGDCVRLFPALKRQGLRGGTLFFEGRADAVRLTLAVLDAAAAAGARLCNHLEVIGARHGAVLLRDHLAGREIAVRASCVLNAAGDRVDEVRRRLGVARDDDLVRPCRRSHIVLPPTGCEIGLCAFPDGDGGPSLLLVPQSGGVLCARGTAGSPELPEPDELPELGEPASEVPAGARGSPRVTPAERDRLLQALGRVLEAPPSPSAVLSGAGGRLAVPQTGGPRAVRETGAGGSLLYSVVGASLTTHRAFAERIVDRLLGRTDRSPSRTAPLPGGAGPQEVGDPLWWRHGSRAPAVRALADGRPELLAPIAPEGDLLMVEAVHALRCQGAVTFTDLVLRRLCLTQGPGLGDAALRALHGLYLRERPLALPGTFEQDRDELLQAMPGVAGSAP